MTGEEYDRIADVTARLTGTFQQGCRVIFEDAWETHNEARILYAVNVNSPGGPWYKIRFMDCYNHTIDRVVHHSRIRLP